MCLLHDHHNYHHPHYFISLSGVTDKQPWKQMQQTQLLQVQFIWHGRKRTPTPQKTYRYKDINPKY